MKIARLLTLFIISFFLAFSVLFVPLSGIQAHTVRAASGTWTLTGSMNVGGSSTATLLNDGEVLATGGGGDVPPFHGTALTELYNPKTGTWTLTGSLHLARVAAPSTLLRNGQVLLVGGIQEGPPFPISFNEAELYDPETGTSGSQVMREASTQ